MKCSNCNAEIDENAKFCPECGSKIEKIQFCANCGTKLEDGATFCSNCGEKVRSQIGYPEKKKCPYCGKEILSTATKCKYCGEWLEDTDEKVENEDETVDNVIENEESLLKQNVPLKNTILEIAFWTAIIGLGVYTLHDLIPEGHHFKLKGKLSILTLCTFIPEWIGYILETIGLSVLLFSLKKAMSKLKNNFSTLFSFLIVAICGINFINIISDSDDFSLGIWIFLIIFTLAQYITTLILGIKISVAYKGELNRLGKIMYIYGIIGLVLFVIIFIGLIIILSNGEQEDLFWLTFVEAIINTLISYYYYKKLMDVQLHPEIYSE